MTQHTIEIEGLPEGWEVESVNVSGINFNNERTSMKVPVIAHIQKIQPRRIVLEETEEVRPVGYQEFYSTSNGTLVQWQLACKTDEAYKIWRVVEEVERSSSTFRERVVNYLVHNRIISEGG